MGENLVANQAYVSLVTNDHYANGALVLAYSLRRVNTTRKLVLLVTNQVTAEMRQQLIRVWDHIETVNPLDSRDDANLALLTRPELGITFTKIRCWNLTQYTKCVFMDADTLVLQNCDELFNRRELSAVPDIGWPDCFNSGVFVFEPSRVTYEALLQYAIDHGSFDGGDQGLLNSFFSNWATHDISTHLSFVYNMNSNASYTYAPAHKQFGRDVKIVHFIGPFKPWHCSYSSETGSACMPPYSSGSPHESNYLQLWWDIYITHVLPVMKQRNAETTYTALCTQPECLRSHDDQNPAPAYIPEPNQFYWKSTENITDAIRTYPEDTHQHTDVPIHTDDQLNTHQHTDVPIHTDDQLDTHHSHNASDALLQCTEEFNPKSYSHIDTSTVIHQVIDQLTLLQIQSEDLEESTLFADQRTAWENGSPDYTGKDRFTNIQEKLDEAIEGESYRDAGDVPVLV